MSVEHSYVLWKVRLLPTSGIMTESGRQMTA